MTSKAIQSMVADELQTLMQSVATRPG
jgi:hypothetical protein